MPDQDQILLQTKLHRPRLTSDLVLRPRLLELLNRGLESRLILVCAPAGFGKTTLVSSWIESITTNGGGMTSPLPAAWLSLDEYDSDLILFLRYFIAALRTIFKYACPEAEELLQASQQPSLAVLSKTLNNEIERLGEHFILVLDDYHSIQGDAVHNLLNQWVRNWPRPLHLVLIARKDPPLSLAGLRARSKIREIRSYDLRFTDNETATFLDRALERPLRNPVIALLIERTEGWIAGLKLASLWLGAAGNTEGFLETLPVTDSGIADYLVEEVLAQQLPAIQMFLQKTSILDRFCAPLCEAVIGEGDPAWNARASIDWIQRLNLFVTSLDTRKEWYRYHPLFQDFLRQRLSAGLGADQVNELHRRAAGWFVAQGQVEEALQHAFKAHDLDLAARIMEAGLRDVLNREDRPTLERWLGQLPEELIRQRPGLLLIKAWVQQFLWQLGAQARVLQQVEDLLEADGGASLTAEDLQILRGQMAAMHAQAAYFNNQPEQAMAFCQEALALIPQSWTYLRGGIMHYMGMSMQASGQEMAAERLLLDEYKVQVGKPAAYNLRLLFGLCFNRLKTGQLEQTRQIARLLLEESSRSRLAVLQSWAEWFLGTVDYQWNDLEVAASYFTRILENRYTAHLSALRDAVAGLALIHQANGEVARAWQMVESISQLDLEQGGIEDERTGSLRARLMLLQGDLEGAGRWADGFTGLPLDKPLLWLEEPQVTRARVLVARGAEADLRLALQILDALDEIAERTYNTRYKIETLALRALALEALGNPAEAGSVLQQTVDLARLGGFIRVFVDLGKPMQVMLRRLAKQDYSTVTIRRILAAFPEHDKNSVKGAPHPLFGDSALVESLTPRELEILSLLQGPMSIKEIAGKLNISYATVRRHIINIYGKLGVNQRWKAVASAEELNLFPAR